MRNLLRAEIWKTLNGAKISQELSAEIIREYGAEKAEAIKTLLSGHQDSYLFLGKSFDRKITEKYNLDADEAAAMAMFVAVKKIELLTNLKDDKFRLLKDYAAALLDIIRLFDSRDKYSDGELGTDVAQYVERLDNAEVRLRTSEGFLLDSLDDGEDEIVFAAMEVFALFICYVSNVEQLKRLFDKRREPLALLSER